jgi:transposase
MRPRQEASEEQIKELQLAMESETRKWFYRRLQCVWLRIKHDMATESVSQATGLTPSYIRKIWARYFRGGLPAIIGKPKGGRRNQHMTPKEEEQFLASHLAMAQKGWILTARKIKESYEQKIGKTVPESTVCRMLSRNNWRIVSTRPTHPEGDPGARDEFKKNSSRRWLPPSLQSHF